MLVGATAHQSGSAPADAVSLTLQPQPCPSPAALPLTRQAHPVDQHIVQVV